MARRKIALGITFLAATVTAVAASVSYPNANEGFDDIGDSVSDNIKLTGGVIGLATVTPTVTGPDGFEYARSTTGPLSPTDGSGNPVLAHHLSKATGLSSDPWVAEDGCVLLADITDFTETVGTDDYIHRDLWLFKGRTSGAPDREYRTGPLDGATTAGVVSTLATAELLTPPSARPVDLAFLTSGADGAAAGIYTVKFEYPTGPKITATVSIGHETDAVRADTNTFDGGAATWNVYAGEALTKPASGCAYEPTTTTTYVDEVVIENPDTARDLVSVEISYDATLAGPIAVNFGDDATGYGLEYDYTGAYTTGDTQVSVAAPGLSGFWHTFSWTGTVTAVDASDNTKDVSLGDVFIEVSCGDDGVNWTSAGTFAVGLAGAGSFTLDTDAVTAGDQACHGRYLQVEVVPVATFDVTPTLDSFQVDYDPDEDGDGYGAVLGYWSGGTGKVDCVDTDTAIHPDHDEICDGKDNDCDNDADAADTEDFEAAPPKSLQAGVCAGTSQTCDGANGWIDDFDSIADYSEDELCDGLDNDCDGLLGDGSGPDADERNLDGDGFVACPVFANDGTTLLHKADTEWSAHWKGNDTNLTGSGDCRDQDGATNPQATEICDGIDNDCDGVLPADETDTDVDKFVECDVAAAGTLATWAGDDNAEGILGGLDCAEGDIFTFPGAAEEESSGPTGDCMTDADEDGWGKKSGVANGVVAGGDCADGDPDIHPDEPEDADGVDQDCDGDTDEGTVNYDDDGDCHCESASTCHGSTNATCEQAPLKFDDCDDDPVTGSIRSPSHAEVGGLANFDDDCDLEKDEGTPAYDHDGDCFCADATSCFDSTATCSGGLSTGDCEDHATVNGVFPELVFPGATENPNGVDESCEGEVDEGTTWYDSDGDCYCPDKDNCSDSIANGSSTGEASTCTTLFEDGVLGDCNEDTVVEGIQPEDINPGEVDAAGNDVDEDCDAFLTCFDDDDEDGSGTALTFELAIATSATCAAPTHNASLDALDCDDVDDTVYPQAPEICDGIRNDCDEWTAGTFTLPEDEADDDGDDYVDCVFDSGEITVPQDWKDDTVTLLGDMDCDDTEDFVFPGATEVCDGRLNDCDGWTGDDGNGIPDEEAVPSDEADQDGDLYVECDVLDGNGVTLTHRGDPVTAAWTEAWRGAGSVLGSADCKPADGTSYPAAEEICDGQYNDCEDGSYADPGAPANETDDDPGGADGYVECVVRTVADLPIDADHPQWAGIWKGPASIEGGADCDDASSVGHTIHPEGDELCDGYHNDCDGWIDSDLDDVGDTPDLPPLEIDNDGDTYVECAFAPNVTAATWGANPTAGVTAGADCHDVGTHALQTHPNAAQLEAQSTACMQDVDDDGYGSDAPTSAEATPGGDCRDVDPLLTVPPGSIHPGLSSEPADANHVDDDCNGLVDDGTTSFDSDGDCYCAGGSCNDSILSPELIVVECGGALKSGVDCDDTIKEINPGEGEVTADGNDYDENCDGSLSCYVDGDQDGQGSSQTTQLTITAAANTCDDSVRFVADNAQDCNDANADSFTGADEICDGFDNDCNASLPTDERDLDSDGYVTCSLDVAISAWGNGTLSGGGDDCFDSANATLRPYARRTHPGAADADVPGTCMMDMDLDNYGASSLPTVVFNGLSASQRAAITLGSDCKDPDENTTGLPGSTLHNFSINKGQSETPYDGIDQNCDGKNDFDVDSDGFAPDPYTDNGPTPGRDPDCNDNNATINPDANEIPYDGIDSDCDGWNDYDADQDGFVFRDHDQFSGALRKGDCDDNNDTINPDAAEVCEQLNQIDNDCDDGVNTIGGNYATEPVQLCGPSGTVGPNGDILTCEGKEPTGPLYLDIDQDGDGGLDSEEFYLCSLADDPNKDRFSNTNTDCDDNNEAVKANAEEMCNGEDDNCNGIVDEPSLAGEGTDPQCVWHSVDGDFDGYGSDDPEADRICMCPLYFLDPNNAGAGVCDGTAAVQFESRCWSDDTADCNDSLEIIRPLAAGETHVEIMDGWDNDCDGRLPLIEVDCDNDNSLALLPQDPPEEGLALATDVGLEDCREVAGPPVVSCFDKNLPLTCSQTSGLWMVNTAYLEELGVFIDGQRTGQDTSLGCRASGDCDDTCASRCPGDSRIERCDGIDNDCNDARDLLVSFDDDGTPHDDNGVPWTLEGERSKPDFTKYGYVTSRELDIDGDNLIECDSTSPNAPTGPATGGVTAQACSTTITGGGDCNSTCFLMGPEATEMCNGFVNPEQADTCAGENGDGALPGISPDMDGDGYRVCGAWTEPQNLEEQIFVLAYEIPHLEEAGVIRQQGEVIPLLSPRARPGAAADEIREVECDAPLRTALGPEQVVDPESGETIGLGVWPDDMRQQLKEDEELEPHAYMLERCIAIDVCRQREQQAFDDSMQDVPPGGIEVEDREDSWPTQAECAELLDSQAECHVLKVTLKADQDALLYEHFAEHPQPACMDLEDPDEDFPEQVITRTVWQRERIVAARKLVVDWECYVAYGTFGCTDDGPLGFVSPYAGSRATPPGGFVTRGEFDEDLLMDDPRWWKEVGRFDVEVHGGGPLVGCWGDPTNGLERIEQDVGGDCDDDSEKGGAASRDSFEGPRDLVGSYLDVALDCSTCRDSRDNNCNGLVDREEPACAECYVGQGLGCSAPTGEGGCDAGRSGTGRASWVYLLAGLALLIPRRRTS